MTRVLLFVFLASLGLDWPHLAGGARLPELLIGPALLAVVINGGRWLRPRVVDLAVIAYLAGSAVGLIATSDRAASALELVRHGYLAIVYLAVALATARGFATTARDGLAASGIVLAVPAVCFAAMFMFSKIDVPAAGELMKLPYAGETLRLRGFTASPTMFACVLTVALPCAIAAWVQPQSERTRLAWGLGIGVLMLALIWTFSHAWAGAALAVTIAGWPLLSRQRALRIASVAAVVVLALVFNATLAASVRSVSTSDEAFTDPTLYPYAMGEGSTHVGPYTIRYSVMSYLRTKQLAWEAFVAHPFTGIGLDRFHELTEKAYQEGRLTAGYRVIDPHSSLLGRLAETGLAGGLTLVALWIAILALGREVLRQRRDSWTARAALAGIAGLLLAGVNVDIMNFRFLWAGAGVVRGLGDRA